MANSVRLVVTTAGVLLLACACGGTKAHTTEAEVQLASPVPARTVFEMSRRHHVRLTEVVSTDVGTDHHTVGVTVSGMDEREVGGEFAVDHFFATGSADDLRSLRGERRVKEVLIKEEFLARVRRARQGQ